MSLVISLSSRDMALFVGINEICVLVFIIMSNLSLLFACMKLIAPRLVFIVIKSLDLGLIQDVSFVLAASLRHRAVSTLLSGSLTSPCHFAHTYSSFICF